MSKKRRRQLYNVSYKRVLLCTGGTVLKFENQTNYDRKSLQSFLNAKSSNSC